mmetsp:Transcript_34015/g.41945  ORF Transcript_34015/g.41945 Transcript_34015/m.41945 type:complete len:192 (-) Transcript_34015:816-1391(-)
MNTSCNYGLKTIYGVEGFILFNLASLIGYKVYLTCYDMAEFTRLGSLPAANDLKLRKGIIITIWVVAAFIPILYIFFNFKWLLMGQKDWEFTEVFQAAFEAADCFLYFSVSIIYMISARIMYRMRKMSEQGKGRSEHKQLRKLHLYFRSFYICYTLLWLCCFFRISSMGYYNGFGLTAITFVNIMISFLKA